MGFFVELFVTVRVDDALGDLKCLACDGLLAVEALRGEEVL